MKTVLIALIGMLMIPNVSFAFWDSQNPTPAANNTVGHLTYGQSEAVLALLQAFGADIATIASVRAVLEPTGAIAPQGAISANYNPNVLPGQPGSLDPSLIATTSPKSTIPYCNRYGHFWFMCNAFQTATR